MKFPDFLQSPERALAFIAIVAVFSLAMFGTISFFKESKSPGHMDKVISVLSDVLMGAAGAKAGLSMQQKQPDQPDQKSQ